MKVGWGRVDGSSFRVMVGTIRARLPVAESGITLGGAPLPRLKVPGAGIPVNRDLGTPCGATYVSPTAPQRETRIVDPDEEGGKAFAVARAQ